VDGAGLRHTGCHLILGRVVWVMVGVSGGGLGWWLFVACELHSGRERLVWPRRWCLRPVTVLARWSHCRRLELVSG